MLKNIKKIFLNILFPESCIGCETFGKLLCEECKKNIISTAKNKNYDTIEWIYNPLSYKNEILKKSLFALKYKHVKNISKYLSELVYIDFIKYLEKINNGNKDIILIPIPISRKRFIERDYNQSEVLIKDIVKKIKENKNLDLEKNIYTDILLKKRHTIKFANTHSSIERENLIKNAFYINENYNKDFLKDKIIILIDDITTTGATFYEARNTLISFGIEKENVFSFALAH